MRFGSVVQERNMVLAHDEQGNAILRQSGQLVSHNSESVTLQVGGYLYTYDVSGRQTSVAKA
jgi:hypothetical protein